MSHIHDLIDFTVVAYIVFDSKILFIHHKKLNKWLPIGGHIELNEDPEQALFREIKEETGLNQTDLQILSSKPPHNTLDQKFLFTPNLLDIHKISDTHQHIGLYYFIRSLTDKVRLEANAHHDIKWLSFPDLKNPKYQINDHIVYAAEIALQLEKTTKS